MELKLDPGTFDTYQSVLVEEMVKTIKVKLIEAGLSDEQLEHSTAEIAFSISSIIDDTAAIEAEDGVEIRPYLTFNLDDSEAIHCGENSYLHERVYDSLKKLFGKKAD
jgi:hypothetical protein